MEIRSACDVLEMAKIEDESKWELIIEKNFD
jgi:hypothetical protein